MKIVALKNHKCYCCGRTIRKGDECFAFMVTPLNPEKSEFEVIYTCLNCLNEESCIVKIRERGGKLNEANKSAPISTSLF